MTVQIQGKIGLQIIMLMVCAHLLVSHAGIFCGNILTFLWRQKVENFDIFDEQNAVTCTGRYLTDCIV